MLFQVPQLLHRTHLNRKGFAKESVNNTSEAGQCRIGRGRFAGRIQRSVMTGKMDKDDGVMKRKRSDKTAALN